MAATTTVTITFDAEKLNATKRYMGKKDAELEQELVEQLQKLYEKHVPAPVRDYIDDATPAAKSPLQSKRKEKQQAAPAEEN